MTARTPYLTPDEVQAAQALHKRAPYSITNVSTSVFSIARYYGGMGIHGCSYTYMPEHDECVRDDVLRLVTKLRKLKAKAAEPKAEQMALPIDAKGGGSLPLPFGQLRIAAPLKETP